MKRLYRSTRSKKIAGVCSGLGEYFNIDPTLIRIFFLLITIFWGFGVLVYLVCWISMPRKEELKSK